MLGAWLSGCGASDGRRAPDEEIMLVGTAPRPIRGLLLILVRGLARVQDRGRVTPAWIDCPLPQRQKRQRGRASAGSSRPRSISDTWLRCCAIPDARIVRLHREPAQCIPSLASLIHSLRVLASDRVDPVDVGREWGDKMRRAIGRCMDVREAHEDRFLDLRYEDLVADPLAQAARIYDFAGLSLGEDVVARMRQWASENAREKRPVHRYTLERFGFDEAGLRRDFARYRERFLAT
jgi:hypothetical protein